MLSQINIVVEQLRPRYVLPLDVPPPTGMTREEFEEWSRKVCGYQDSILSDGQVLLMEGRMHMSQATYWEMVRTLK